MQKKLVAGGVILLILVGIGVYVANSASELEDSVGSDRAARNPSKVGSVAPKQSGQSKPAGNKITNNKTADSSLSGKDIQLIWHEILQFDKTLVHRVASPAKITVPITDTLRENMHVPDGVTAMVIHEASVVLRRPTSAEMDGLAARCGSMLSEVKPQDLRAALSRYYELSKGYRIVSLSSKESWTNAAPGLTWTIYDCDEVSADIGDDGKERRFYSPEDPSPVESVAAPKGVARYGALFTTTPE